MVVPLIVTVKLAAAARAEMTGSTINDAKVVLQVTPNLVPKVSSDCMKIWLLAVTAVVLICSVAFVPVGTATLPAAAEPQTAGEAEEEQLVLDW